MSRTTTTAAMMPHVPPGKVRVVVLTSVAVVVIDPSVVVVGVVAVPVVVGCVPCVVGDGCCWSTLPAVPAAAGGVVWAFVF